MTRKENALAYMRCLPCECPPEPWEINVMMGSDLVHILNIPVCERPMSGSGYDIFGVHWSATEGVSHYTQGQDPVYDDIEDWASQVRFPNIEKFEWDKLAAENATIDRENTITGVVMYNGPFERTTMLTSFEDCLCNLMIDPESFSDLIGAIADYKIALIHKIAEVANPDFYLLHDDWGTARAPFMRPELWREVIKPHTKRIYDAILSHGGIVMQHSCGVVEPFIPDMIEMGAHGWDGQTQCNDYPKLKELYGDRFLILEKAMKPLKEGETAEPPKLTEWPAYQEYPEFLFE